MIIRYLQDNNATNLIISALVMLIALVFHNVFQSYIASRLGDSNPRFAGYMSFDIQRQLEPTGVLFLFLLGFGWPQAIPTNSRNYKGRGTQEAWVWYGGPLAYLIVALVAALVAAVFLSLGNANLFGAFSIASGTAVLHAVINLFPVFPLDGAKAVLAWGNPSLRRFVQQIASFGPFGFIIFFFILSTLGVTGAIAGFFQGLIFTIVRLIPGL